MKRNKYIGNDVCGEYTYYNIIDFDICVGCKHFYDNVKMCRFECDTENCKKINEGLEENSLSLDCEVRICFLIKIKKKI